MHKRLSTRVANIMAGAALAFGTMVGALPALAETPFQTGVWQLNTPEGPRGLVMSDWLIFENGLPQRWLYRHSNGENPNQIDFFTRSIGTSGYTPLGVRVERIDDNTMQFTIAEKDKNPVSTPAVRLSIPDASKSCLSVDDNGETLLGRWQGTSEASFKTLSVTKTALVIDGKSQDITVEPVRVGRLGILENGKPVAFLTDAGGDYAVLQWFKDDVTPEVMRDPSKEILDFKAEDIVKNPRGNCDQQIAARLKTMKK